MITSTIADNQRKALGHERMFFNPGKALDPYQTTGAGSRIHEGGI